MILIFLRFGHDVEARRDTSPAVDRRLAGRHVG